MASGASFFLALATCLLPSVVDGFSPTLLLGVAGLTPKTHQKMTVNAIRKIAVDIMSANPDMYPDQKATWMEAQDVIEEFKKAVASPDFKESDVHKAHFDSETFVDASGRLVEFRQTVITSIQTKKMGVAREYAGRALHTLQDFYSHSNWIEMGNRQAYPELGEKRIEASKVARVDQKTCTNCIPLPEVPIVSVCINNIVREINEQELLTSGYYESLWKLLNFKLKPSGKCSHGGVLDATSYRIPIGGINKDTFNPALSPHAYLHLQAAEAALESTINFLESIRLAVKTEDGLFEDELFAEFIGIPVGWSLCFIVDTTGSMGSSIAAVRDISIAITEATSSSTGRQKPSNFVLSPFNDPDYGPVFTTNDADEMIAQLSALTADGGGDEPELAFHGIIAALNSVRDGSTCYFFTDASAKDSELYPEAISLALTKSVKIVQFLTGGFRRRRSARRQKRSAYPYYSDLSSLTGGSVLEISNTDINQAVGVVASDSGYSQMSVFTADNIYRGFTFYSDISITEVKVQLIDSSSSLESVTFTSPSGVPFDNFTEVLGLSSVRIYNLTEPEPGLWRVNVSNSDQPFTAIVTASTPVDFTYIIAILNEGIHSGYFAISGNPISGVEYYIVVNVVGAFDPFDDVSTNILSNITFILLVSQTGDILTRLPALELDPLKEYTAKTIVPTSGFRVAIEGEDTDGNVVQRYDKAVVSAVVIQLEISIEGSGSFSLFPDSSLHVNVTVTSVGELATWYIRVSDTGNFYTGETPIGVTLDRNESSVIYLGFQVPSNATYGFVSTVTVSAGTSSTSSVENYNVFYINVKSTLADDTQPLCAVDRVEGVCSGTRSTPDCVNTTWSVHFHVRDSESGMKSISPAGASLTYSNYTFQVDNFTEGSNSSISGVYTSSCCHPEVSIIATDVFGNIGRCFVSNDPVSPLCTVLKLRGSCRLNYAAGQTPTCESETWQGSFLVSDAGSGLAQIEAITSSTDYTLEPSDVPYGTVDVVNGTYQSSCCQQTAIIQLTDVAGNRGQCTLVATTTSSSGGNSGRKTRNLKAKLIRNILKKNPKYKGARFTKTGRGGSRHKKPGLVLW